MNNDLKDILSNSNKDIDNQQLLAYLSDQLSKSNKHEVEKTMADDDFMNDAIEGLQQIDRKKNIAIHLEELQASLQKQLAKNAKRKKRRWQDNPQAYLITVILIVLLLICFVVIKKHLDNRTTQQQLIHPSTATSSVNRK